MNVLLKNLDKAEQFDIVKYNRTKEKFSLEKQTEQYLKLLILKEMKLNYFSY